MSANTSIEWTEKSWNPLRGCSRVSNGCRNCYAERIATRLSGKGQPYEGLITLRQPRRTETGKADGPTHGENGRVRTGVRGQWNGQIRLVESALLEPLKWRKPARVFVNSMSDLFHEDVPDEFIDRVFHVMQQAERHTFQILTKRSDRMMRYSLGMAERDGRQRGARVLASSGFPTTPDQVSGDGFPWPLPNVWLGVSCENRDALDRLRHLRATPAAVRFVSVEPLIEDLGDQNVAVHFGRPVCKCCEGGRHVAPDWVIVGGESGPGARRCNVAWVRRIVQQCQASKVPVFVKQLGAVVIDRNDAGFMGEWPEAWPDHIDIEDRVEHDLDGTRDGYQGAPVRVHLRDRKGGDISEWPEDLRVRQFPHVEAT